MYSQLNRYIVIIITFRDRKSGFWLADEEESRNLENLVAIVLRNIAKAPLGSSIIDTAEKRIERVERERRECKWST